MGKAESLELKAESLSAKSHALKTLPITYFGSRPCEEESRKVLISIDRG